jgi:hypothetical protein
MIGDVGVVARLCEPWPHHSLHCQWVAFCGSNERAGGISRPPGHLAASTFPSIFCSLVRVCFSHARSWPLHPPHCSSVRSAEGFRGGAIKAATNRCNGYSPESCFQTPCVTASSLLTQPPARPGLPLSPLSHWQFSRAPPPADTGWHIRVPGTRSLTCRPAPGPQLTPLAGLNLNLKLHTLSLIPSHLLVA